MTMPPACFVLLWLCFQVQVPAGLPEPGPEPESKEEPAATPAEAPAEPPPFSETLVVTASRAPQPISDAVAPTTVLSRDDLARSPDLTLDDRLRQVPGFGLLRRSSSLTAHPTGQGVSLRGLGPSGASRTLVLLDGSPLNDPFGGWVAWNRVPVAALESIEVARGALSQLYGSAALGGAIQLLPRSPSRQTLEVTARGGDRSTGDLEVFASDASHASDTAGADVEAGARPWGWTLAGRRFATGGFQLLAPADRGAVDRPAGVDFGALYGRLQAGRAHLAVNLFEEQRENGTALQENDTRLRALEAGWSGGQWEVDVHAQSQRFRSTFSRVLPDRSQEFLTARQDVETRSYGGAGVWRPAGGRLAGLLAGADVRSVSWDRRDQTLGGVFAQQTWSLTPRLDLLAGARVDLWRSSRTRTSFNPRLGALFRATDGVTLRASAYRGFRAPTLNELYRPFRVGNVETLANPDLDEESLVGAEVGADLHPRSDLWLRLDAFRSRIDDAVGNVTLAVTPQLITRQRANLDRVEVSGAEAEARWRPAAAWQVRAAWLYTDSRVARTGRRVPQVPWHQGSLGISWDAPRAPAAVALQARWAGEQFEDDLNQLPLDPYLVVDLALRRRLSGRLELSLAVENLLDEEVETGRLPLPTFGAPRLVQLGLAVRR